MELYGECEEAIFLLVVFENHHGKRGLVGSKCESGKAGSEFEERLEKNDIQRNLISRIGI